MQSDRLQHFLSLVKFFSWGNLLADLIVLPPPEILNILIYTQIKEFEDRSVIGRKNLKCKYTVLFLFVMSISIYLIFG